MEIKDKKVSKTAFHKRSKEERSFRSILKEDVLEIINNLANWSSSYSIHHLKCKKCKEGLGISILDHFVLWNKDDKLNICFHFRCACREGTSDILNEIVNCFNYRMNII